MVLAIDNPEGPDAYIVDEDNSDNEVQLAPKFNASVSGSYNIALQKRRRCIPERHLQLCG